MDIVLFTVTAACCFYQFANSSSASTPTGKQQRLRRNSTVTDNSNHNATWTRRCTVETKPLVSPFVQDWMREFPHLAAAASSLGDIIVPPTTATHNNNDSSQPQAPQAQPRVVGLLIDTSSSCNSRDTAASSMALFEKAVAANDSLKIVYIVNDWSTAPSAETTTLNSAVHDMHPPHHYRPVSFGLTALKTTQADDNKENLRHNVIFNVQHFLQVCVQTVLEMIGIQNPSSNTTITSTTTTLRLVHSITGLVLTQEGWNHMVNNTAASSLDHGNSSNHSISSHGSSNAARRAANPQDNWIEI